MTELVAPAKPVFDQGFDQGYKAGYDAGYTDGHGKGYDAGYGRGYDDGYDRAYDIGYQRGFQLGYRDGAAEGGAAAAEEAVPRLLPSGHILPQYTAEELIRRGVDTCRDDLVPLLSGRQVAERIEAALDKKEPLSVVRLGDGESLVLAQEVVLEPAAIRRRAPWLVQAGVEVPDLAARDLLHQSVLKAGIVGVPTSRMPNHQPLLFRAFEALGVEWQKLTLTHAVINYMVQKEGWLKKALGDRSVLLVGNRAVELYPVLARSGVRVAGAVGPVRGVRDVERVMEEVRRRASEFDMAFVAAGVAAVILCQRIACEMGKVALDFGHLADELVRGQTQW